MLRGPLVKLKVYVVKSKVHFMEHNDVKSKVHNISKDRNPKKRACGQIKVQQHHINVALYSFQTCNNIELKGLKVIYQ